MTSPGAAAAAAAAIALALTAQGGPDAGERFYRTGVGA